MTSYEYRGINEAGRAVSGTVEAESTAEALRILKEWGLRGVYVGPLATSAGVSGSQTASASLTSGTAEISAKPTAAPDNTPSPPETAARPSGNHPLNWTELAELNAQLLGLVRAGLPLAPSIAATARFMNGRAGRAVAQRLQGDIEAGQTLAGALERQPASFPPLCRAMMRAGEASGSVEQVLACLADYSRTMAETRNRVIETITYPLVLIAAAFGLTMFMLLKVVPLFNEVFMGGFMEYGRPAALIFGAWLSLAQFADTYGPALFLLFPLVLAGIVWLCVPRPGGRLRFLWADTVRLRLPLFGKLNRMGAMAQFCRALGMLVEARTPLPEALEMAGAASGNLAVEAAGMRAVEQVRAGGALGEALIRAGRFDAGLCWLVQNAERQQTLGETLRTLAGTYENNAEQHRRWVLMALGPLTTIVIGIFVGLMFFSVYGPLITGTMV